MLKISNTQYDAMRQQALNQYVERTLAQFKKYFPGPSHVVGDDPLREMIRLGVERAKSHRILGQGNVVMYTSVMLLCGSYFDEDPQYPWGRRVLEDPDLTTERVRAERLYDEFVAYWDRVAAGDRQGLIKAALRSRKQPVQQFDSATPDQVAKLLREGWPKKAAELGDDGMDALLQKADRLAGDYAMTSQRDHAVASMLMFTLGSGFDKDPMHPWAGQVLSDTDITPEDRGARLYEAGQAYAGRWVQFAKQEAP